MNPASVPVKAGSRSPYVFPEAAGVTEAAFVLIFAAVVAVAVLSVDLPGVGPVSVMLLAVPVCALALAFDDANVTADDVQATSSEPTLVATVQLASRPEAGPRR